MRFIPRAPMTTASGAATRKTTALTIVGHCNTAEKGEGGNSVKHTTKPRKTYTALARKIAVGLASGLLVVGIGQSPSIVFAHPDPNTTGSYSTTGDVSGGKYTVERGSGLAVTTEAAGGAAVNPDKPAVSATNSTLTVNGMLSNSGYGGYAHRETIGAATAAQNSLALNGTIMVTPDDDRLYGAFGGFANIRGS